MSNIIHSIIGILAVINPVVCATMLLQLEGRKDNKVKIQDGIKAMLIVMIILLIATIAGKYILNIFGISMDAFKAVGGIILSMIGFNMLVGTKNNSTTDTSDQGLAPLIFFAASPGTISMVITLAAAHDMDEGFPVSVIIGIVLAIVITIIIISTLVFASGKKKMGQNGIISRYMGLIIVAMGLQFMLDGIKHFFQL